MKKGFSAKKGFKLSAKDLVKINATVTEFNKVIGNDLLTADQEQREKLRKTYKSLSLEEIQGKRELMESFKKGDKAGILDGICDLIFTGFAYCTLAGERCNLERNETWFIEQKWRDKDLVVNKEQLLFEMVEDLKQDNAFNFQTSLLVFLGAVYRDFDIVSGFNRVSKSNFSKAIPLADLKCVETELELIAKAGRYSGLGTRQVGDYMVFTAREDLEEGRKFASPKVIKASSFVDVDALGGLLEFCK